MNTLLASGETDVNVHAIWHATFDANASDRLMPAQVAHLVCRAGAGAGL